jgi:hypothetical protein
MQAGLDEKPPSVGGSALFSAGPGRLSQLGGKDGNEDGGACCGAFPDL